MAGTSNHPSAAQMQARMEAACERGILLSTEHILTESRRLTPLDEGPLERSGKATQDGLRGAVSYNTPYAVRQHEDLTYRHAPGRRAKYLEMTALSERSRVAAIHARAIERGMR